MKLTGRRGINVLKWSKKIHEFVNNGGYEEAIEDNVQEIMDTWLILST